MALTDEQLKALGLYSPPPDVSPASAPMPAAIPSAAPLPASSLGSKIPPGALIPTSHAQGKEEFRQLTPQITATPGSADYFRQRQSQLDFKAQHPFGDPISAHPGLGGKILHGLSVAGNIAGNIVAPGTMAMIPGTQLNKQVQEGQNLKGITEGTENAAREAQTGLTEETTKEAPEKLSLEKRKVDLAEQDKASKPEPIFDKSGQIVGFNTGTDLVGLHNPKLTPDMKEIAGLAKPKEGVAAHITYDQGIPVSVTSPDNKTYDINDPKLPPELKPLVDAANRAHGQHLNEESTRQARTFAQQEKMFEARQEQPTNTTRAMLDAAPHVEQFIQRINPLIDKLEKSGKLGPGAGRWNELWAGKIGAGDPDFTRLRTDVGLLTTLLMRMHVGARGGEYIMQHFSDMINSGKQNPETMRAALGEVQAYAQQLSSEKPGNKTEVKSEPATSSAGHTFTLNGQRYEGVPEEIYKKYKGKPGFSE